MKKLLLPIFIGFLITGCNSSGGSSEPAISIPVEENETENTDTNSEIFVNPNGFTEAEIRENWNVPPLPTPDNPDYNTINGVDDYGVIGARDDWEVKNAIATYPDKREFDILNKAAVNNTKMMAAYESRDDEMLKELFDEYIWILACHSYYYFDDNKNKAMIRLMAKNTEERESFDKDMAKRINSLLTESISMPTFVERDAKCPTFITQ